MERHRGGTWERCARSIVGEKHGKAERRRKQNVGKDLAPKTSHQPGRDSELTNKVRTAIGPNIRHILEKAR